MSVGAPRPPPRPTNTTRGMAGVTISDDSSRLAVIRPSRRVTWNSTRSTPGDPSASTRVSPFGIVRSSWRCSVTGSGRSSVTWDRSTRTTLTAAPGGASSGGVTSSSPSRVMPSPASSSPTEAADEATSVVDPSWVTFTVLAGASSGSRANDREARSRARWSASSEAAMAAERRVGRWGLEPPRTTAAPTAIAATTTAMRAGPGTPPIRRRRARPTSGLVGGIAAR